MLGHLFVCVFGFKFLKWFYVKIRLCNWKLVFFSATLGYVSTVFNHNCLLQMKRHPILEMGSAVLLVPLLLCCVCMSVSGDPPMILNWGGLESSCKNLLVLILQN